MQLTKQNYDLDVTDIIKKTKIRRKKIMALENKERELLYHAKEIYNLFEKNSISEKEVLNIPIKKQIEVNRVEEEVLFIRFWKHANSFKEIFKTIQNNEENSKCGGVSQGK